MAPSFSATDSTTTTIRLGPSGSGSRTRAVATGMKGTRNQRQIQNSSNDSRYVDSSVESGERLVSHSADPSSTRHYPPSSSHTKATAANPTGGLNYATNNANNIANTGHINPYSQLGQNYVIATSQNLDSSDNLSDESNNATTGPGIIVRGEEVGIVVVVLLLWVGAIILFFNRWGKIRMLEPYQPKFCENHRPSCPMADATSLNNYPRTYSKFNLSTDMLGSGSPHFAKCNYHGIPATDPFPLPGMGSCLTVPGHPGLMHIPSRQRQNSVFVTSPNSGITLLGGSVFKNSSRKTKSAIDLSSLVLSEEFMENVRRNSKNSITQL